MQNGYIAIPRNYNMVRIIVPHDPGELLLENRDEAIRVLGSAAGDFAASIAARARRIRLAMKCSYRANEYPDLSRLAWYIALSALLTRVSEVVPSFGKIEIPILTLILGLITRSRTLISHGA